MDDPGTSSERGGSGGVEEFGYRQELKRTLSFTDLLVYGLIFMVPIAPFGIFGSVFQGAGGMVALAYDIGMVAMMFTALSYSQMSRAFPMAGSVYTYAGRGIAAPVGFLSGWMILLDYVLIPSVAYLIAGLGIHAAIPAVPVWAWIAVLVVVNTVINYFGIRITARRARCSRTPYSTADSGAIGRRKKRGVPSGRATTSSTTPLRRHS